ncbi:MAG: hypothetical protein QXN66_05920 [Thermoplasmatales archaeon]
MRYLALFLVTLILLSSIYGEGVYAHTEPGKDHGYNGPSGNFTVQVDGQNLLVFKYINITNTSQQFSRIHQDGMQPGSFYWQGDGNITMMSAINLSKPGNFSWENQQINFVYLYTNYYVGILMSDGAMTVSSGTIRINAYPNQPWISVEYFTTPFSQYDMEFGTYNQNGNQLISLNSEFQMRNGSLYSYSLLKGNTSLDVISSISGGEASGNQVAVSVSSFTGNIKSIVVPTDSHLPTIFMSSLGYNLTVNFENFVTLSSSDSKDSDNHSQYFLKFPEFLEREEYLISVHGKTLGFAVVYGSSEVNNSTLSLGGPLSFAVIRFLNPKNPEPVIGKENSTNGAEVVLSKGAYYIPLSSNVSLQQMTFSNGNLFLSIFQNGSGYIFIVLEGNWSFVSSQIYAPSGPSNYTITKEGNFTVVTYRINGTGTTNLTLSVAPTTMHKFVGIYYLILFVLAAVAISLSTIYLSRRKWIKSFEKE